jgi:hypothetical protein
LIHQIDYYLQGGVVLDAEGNTTYKTMQGDNQKLNGKVGFEKEGFML